MSIEAMGTPPVADVNVSVGSQAGVEDSKVNLGSDVDSKADSVDLDSDPTESFESWLARQNKKEEKLPKSEENGKKQVKKESKEDIEVTKFKENVTKEPEKIETSLPQKIKLGDKEYTQEELSKELTAGKEAAEKLETVHSQVEQLVEMLRKNPGEILDKIGFDKVSLENWYYETHIAPQTLTPEQRQAKEDREFRVKREKEDAERKERENAEAAERLKNQYLEEYNKKVTEGLKQGGLPETVWTRQQAFIHMQAAHQAQRPIDMIEIVGKVKQDLIALQKSIVSGLAPEQLVEHLGEDAIAKLRAHDIAKVKQEKFEPKKVEPSKTKPKKEEKRKLTSVYDILENL